MIFSRATKKWQFGHNLKVLAHGTTLHKSALIHAWRRPIAMSVGRWCRTACDNVLLVSDPSTGSFVCEHPKENLSLTEIWKMVLIVHYDTSTMKRFLTSVSLQHEPKASDVITLVKKTFFRTSIVRNFISRGVKMRISAREACVKPHLRTRSDINIYTLKVHNSFWVSIK